MAVEDKKSRFTFKSVILSGIGIVLTSWAVPKALDHFLDTTLLATFYGSLQVFLLSVWSWLVKAEPHPNWYPVGLTLAALFIAYVAFYFYRLYRSTLKELNAELAAKVAPTTPKLTYDQRFTLTRLAGELEAGPMLSSFSSFGRGSLFNSLEHEMALGQLEKMGLVEFTNSEGATASARKPTLTLKGMEYVSAHRKELAKKKQEKVDAATPSS
ncbi:hypothetical protein V9K81_08225 [Pseudomonas monteilii]|uniref:hypothetical protein n=1 Tax=Pseudomonas monteilii TaxID=76759 RepID=UPI0030D2B235